MWFWQSTMSVSLNHIKCVVKMGFVLCELGIEFCAKFKRISHFNGHIMTQALSHQPLTTEVKVRYQASPHGICGGWSGTGALVFPSVSFHHCSIQIFIYVPLLPEGHRQNLGTFQKQCSFRYHRALDIKVLPLFFGLKRVKYFSGITEH
jgi:hypothetical protein